MHLIHCLIVLGMLLLWTHELLLFENLRYVCVNNQWGFLCVSGGSFVEQTDDSEIRELGYQPAEQLSVLYWGNCVKQCCVPVKSDECCIFMHLFDSFTAGSDSSDCFPSSVVRSAWFSGANRPNRLVIFQVESMKCQ